MLTEETHVIWIVTAEYRTLKGIVDNGGVPDCTEVSCFVAYEEWGACWPEPVSAVLPPGTWWFYIAPFFQDESDCVPAYKATVVVRAPADLDADGIVGHDDFEILLDDWGPCPEAGPCLPDIDGDGSVGVTDFLILLASWTE